MTDQVKQQQINNAVWAACDTFRGVVDAAGYKDYILVMLFLKYVSDVWKSHVEKYEREYANVPEAERKVRIERRMSRERFILPMVELKTVNEKTGEEKVVDTFRGSFDSLHERRKEPNIGEIINIVLEALEDANRAKLEGVFRKIDFNNESNLGEAKDRNRRLRNMLEDFAKPELDLRPERVDVDVIGEAYIYLISRFASDAGKKAGEFYTPAPVSRLLAKLAAPKPGDKICDPACGSGSLLIRAAEEVDGDNYALFGQEVNGQTWALARMNMFLHAKDAARIEWCDTLNSPKLVENNKLQKFDIVVANPPFSLDKWGSEDAGTDKFKRYWRADGTIPPKSKADYAFITHMIEIAERRKGRVAVIVPHGVLFRSGAEGRIREALIRENLLDAVIGLPANLFTTTGIPVAILVFDRSREQGGPNEKRRDVVFIDASRDFTPGKKVNMLEDAHVARILETYAERRSVERYAHVAILDEISENDFNLNIPRYVDTFQAEKEIDVAAVQEEIEQIEGELAEIRTRMAKHLKELSIG
jgi:type I restriction enzyme M protein